MNLQHIHPSKKVRAIIFALGVAVLALLVFQAGVLVGYHKARFGAKFGDSFHKNFVDPHRDGFFGKEFSDRGIPGGHGAIGEIVSISLPRIIVAGPDNLEKTILVGTTTHIREFQNELTTNDLRVGRSILVLGTPTSDGEIEAKLIRLVPPSSTNSTSTAP